MKITKEQAIYLLEELQRKIENGDVKRDDNMESFFNEYHQEI